MYGRPYALPNGGRTTVFLPPCTCGARRGPDGGVCGNCGNAIPSLPERRVQVRVTPGGGLDMRRVDDA